MITVKCTCNNPEFCSQIVDLKDQFNIEVEVYDARYFDTKKKGYLKCKSAFSARLDPFVGIWKNNIPIKGFYTEANECTIDNIVNYLNELNEEDFSEDNSDG